MTPLVAHRIALADMVILVDNRNEHTIPGGSGIKLVKISDTHWQVAEINGQRVNGSRLTNVELDMYTL